MRWGRSVVLAASFFILTGVQAKAQAAMPLPTSSLLYEYDFVADPVRSDNPALAKPLGVGDVANGTLSLALNLPEFSSFVDVYVAIYAPKISPEVYLLNTYRQLQPASVALNPFAWGVNGPITASLFGDIPLSLLPDGPYYFYVAVAPFGRMDTFYLWETGFSLSSNNNDDPGSGGTGQPDAKLAGSWRVYSEYLYYDAGGGSTVTPVTTKLNLNADGTWQFGSSSGTWGVASITSSDWAKWGISPYGTTSRKIVLNNWAGGTADGPIDETSSGVDFIWVVYRVSQPDPGTVWVKFGH